MSATPGTPAGKGATTAAVGKDERPQQPPVPPVQQDKPICEGQTWLKEIVAAGLAAGTFAFLIVFYFQLVRLPADLPSDAGRVAAAREVEQARTENTRKAVDGLFAIFAAFVGYYAGRIPAERAAAASQRAASASAAEASAANQLAANAGAEAKAGANLLRKALPTVRQGPAPAPKAGPDLGLTAEIEAFIERCDHV